MSGNEPARLKKGTPRMRRFFARFGIMSARAERGEADDV